MYMYIETPMVCVYMGKYETPHIHNLVPTSATRASYDLEAYHWHMVSSCKHTAPSSSPILTKLGRRSRNFTLIPACYSAVVAPRSFRHFRRPEYSAFLAAALLFSVATFPCLNHTSGRSLLASWVCWQWQNRDTRIRTHIAIHAHYRTSLKFYR